MAPERPELCRPDLSDSSFSHVSSSLWSVGSNLGWGRRRRISQRSHRRRLESNWKKRRWKNYCRRFETKSYCSKKKHLCSNFSTNYRIIRRILSFNKPSALGTILSRSSSLVRGHTRVTISRSCSLALSSVTFPRKVQYAWDSSRDKYSSMIRWGLHHSVQDSFWDILYLWIQLGRLLTRWQSFKVVQLTFRSFDIQSSAN